MQFHVLLCREIQPADRLLGHFGGDKHAVHVLLGHQIQPADRVLGHFGGERHAVHVLAMLERFNQPIGSWNTSAVTRHAVHVLLCRQIQPADRVLGHFGGDKHAVHVRRSQEIQPADRLLGHFGGDASATKRKRLQGLRGVRLGEASHPGPSDLHAWSQNIRSWQAHGTDMLTHARDAKVQLVFMHQHSLCFANL